MTLAHNISRIGKDFARKRADRKLVRQLRKSMPGMMAEMDKMAGAIARSDVSLKDVMDDAARLGAARIAAMRDITIAMQPPVAPVIAAAADALPPFDPGDCTILQNPMNVPRHPIRVRTSRQLRCCA